MTCHVLIMTTYIESSPHDGMVNKTRGVAGGGEVKIENKILERALISTAVQLSDLFVSLKASFSFSKGSFKSLEIKVSAKVYAECPGDDDAQRTHQS